ncbi:MAG: peptidoglycan-binding protein LysM [Saprospiraceae bacterium]|nr:peptidoglycan-binding protein LysM [Saprospiraceae bacterium]
MGLFSFLKNAGAKILTKKATSAAEDEETIRLREELEKRQKMILLRGVIDGLGIPIKNLELDVNGDKVTIYGQAKSQSEREKVVLALGNVSGIGFVDDRISVTRAAKEAEFYTVKRGDSLSKIAKRFYGDPMKYNKIFEANKPMLKDPNKIYPGQMLRIPK